MAPARHPTLGQGRVERLGQEVGGEAAAGRGQQGRKRGVGEARLEVDERREQIHGGWVRAARLHDVSRHICLQIKVTSFSSCVEAYNLGPLTASVTRIEVLLWHACGCLPISVFVRLDFSRRMKNILSLHIIKGREKIRAVWNKRMRNRVKEKKQEYDISVVRNQRNGKNT